MTQSTQPLNLSETYFHLEGDHGEVIAIDESFWPDVISGKRKLDGWLVAWIEMRSSPSHAERHPRGDEILMLISGELDVVFQDVHGQDEERVTLRPGQACFVAKGRWHRQVVRTPGRLLALTCGKGTEHRPLAPD